MPVYHVNAPFPISNICGASYGIGIRHYLVGSASIVIGNYCSPFRKAVAFSQE